MYIGVFYTCEKGLRRPTAAILLYAVSPYYTYTYIKRLCRRRRWRNSRAQADDKFADVHPRSPVARVSRVYYRTPPALYLAVYHIYSRVYYRTPPALYLAVYHIYLSLLYPLRISQKHWPRKVIYIYIYM